jgi:hypothetical protein
MEATREAVEWNEGPEGAFVWVRSLKRSKDEEKEMWNRVSAGGRRK